MPEGASDFPHTVRASGSSSTSPPAGIGGHAVSRTVAGSASSTRTFAAILGDERRVGTVERAEPGDDVRKPPPVQGRSDGTIARMSTTIPPAFRGRGSLAGPP